MNTSNSVVIVDGLRSPMGVKKGQLIGIHPHELAAQVVRALFERNKNFNPADIDDVVLGCAFPEAGQGMLMARGVAILAGVPKEAGAKVVNRFCGSSMDAVHQIAQAIMAGDIDVGLAIGVEDMFGIPMGGFNPSFHPGLAKLNYYIGMGETAEILAKKGNISREEQEEFSVQSHQKALQARGKCWVKNEMTPIAFNGHDVTQDEGPREPDIEKMKTLKPAFLADGTITAATSSPISIGAAAMIVTSRRYAEQHKLPVRATIISRAVAGVEWEEMGKGPIPASEKALRKAGLKIGDIDAIELNEAFAAQSLYVIKATGWPKEKINMNGGAIALGHPLGMSGLRILITLMNVMEQRDLKRGLATMCIGTGQGIATVIER
jgi:acetyl-CoA acyltransferase